MRARAVVAALACCLAALLPASSEAADGDLDPSFGGTGVVTVPFAHDYQNVGGLALQPDGKIVVAGTVSKVCFA